MFRRKSANIERGAAAPGNTLSLTVPATKTGHAVRLPRTFDSLRTPEYRWYLISSLGWFGAMQMQTLVRGYLVFQLTGSFAALGTIALANSLPGLALTMVGGLVADRFRRKRVVQLGQTASAVTALVLGLLALAGILEFWHLLVSAAVQSVIMSLSMPSRQSMLPEVVGMERFMNASALNTGGMQMMGLVAPAAGGFLLAGFGADWVFFLMTASYIFTVLMLFKVPDRNPQMVQRMATVAAARRRMSLSPRNLASGLGYVAKEPTVRVILGSSLLITLFAMPYQMMLPGFVSDVLDGDATMLGTLQSVGGIGALSGALFIASSPSRGRGKMLLASALIAGGALIVFSLSSVVWVTALAMVVIGVGQAMRQSLGQVLVQSYVLDEYRGRAMSVYLMQQNLVSLGTFFAGVLASLVGPQFAIGGLAVSMIVVACALYTVSPRLRQLD